jgi:hypothetical protein
MNVFVVRSPYCYINALEIRHKLKMSAESCCLLIGYSKINDIDVQHFEKVYHEEDWAGRAYYPRNTSDAYKEWAKPRPKIIEFFLKVIFLKKYVANINKLLPPKSTVNNVILQNIDDYSFLHIANSLKPAEIYCLDEGPKSLWTNKLRKKARLEFDIHKVLHGLKRTIMTAFFCYRVEPVTKVTYFSCYDIPVENGEKLIRHSFEYLQESAFRLPRDQNLIYFIGSSLSEVGVVSEDFYVKSLKVIVDSFAPKKVIYIAHRGDSSDKLMRIRSDVGIEVKTYNIPFELQLAMFGPIPDQIASFYSSVLINCAEMFQSALRVTSFRIPTQELSSQHRAQIETVYEYFLSHVSGSFSVVDIR